MARARRNRTAIHFCSALAVALAPAVAQTPPATPAAQRQVDAIDELVTKMRAAEAALKSLRLELETEGRLPSGLSLRTRGVLHVLRGTQPSLRTQVEYWFADGLAGRSDAVQDAHGILLHESDPAFGDVLVRIAPAVVADLEWAGEVLKRQDLPGMTDPRAQSPFGSGLIAELRRSFVLAVDGRRQHDGEAGTWIVGPRRPGLDEQDPDQPLADRVELFVRERDHVLTLARFVVGDDVVQEIRVTAAAIDGELPAAVFQLDVRGLKPRDVQQHQPLWEQIDQVLRRAEAKAPDGAVRPSKK
jgi:hypothetical protein